MRVVRDACHGLDYAHRAGVVHRDVKPGNLLVAEETGMTKLADFGIAKAAEQTRITQVGSVLGTAAYLSPEQARGDEAGPASDIYSLGVCAYQFLAGRLPHEYGSLTELALKQQEESVVPIADYRPEVPPELDLAIRQSLERDPEARYASGLEMAQALEAGPAGRADRRHPRARPAGDTDATRALAATTARHPRGARRRARAPQTPPPRQAPAAESRTRRAAAGSRSSPLLAVLIVVVAVAIAVLLVQRRRRRQRRRAGEPGRRAAADRRPAQLHRRALALDAPPGRGAAQPKGSAPASTRSRVRRILPRLDRGARTAHQLGHEGQVVQRQQPLGGQLAGAHEVVQVAARVLAAGRAGAALDDRLATAGVLGLRQVEPPARLRVGDQRRAVAAEARRRRAVEGVDPVGDGVDDVVDVADAEQVPRRRVGQRPQRPADHLAHLLLGVPQRAADRDPVHVGRGDVGGRLGAQVLVDAALHDPVERLPGRRVLALPGRRSGRASGACAPSSAAV